MCSWIDILTVKLNETLAADFVLWWSVGSTETRSNIQDSNTNLLGLGHSCQYSDTDCMTAEPAQPRFAGYQFYCIHETIRNDVSREEAYCYWSIPEIVLSFYLSFDLVWFRGFLCSCHETCLFQVLNMSLKFLKYILILDWSFGDSNLLQIRRYWSQRIGFSCLPEIWPSTFRRTRSNGRNGFPLTAIRLTETSRK